MAETVRVLVDKLIALALNNPNAEEARSAAMKAVSLIQEHKLLDAARPTYQPMPGQPSPVYYQPPPVDWSERLRQAQKEQQAAQQQAYAEYEAQYLGHLGEQPKP